MKKEAALVRSKGTVVGEEIIDEHGQFFFIIDIKHNQTVCNGKAMYQLKALTGREITVCENDIDLEMKILKVGARRL